jgi:hypothetical protein
MKAFCKVFWLILCVLAYIFTYPCMEKIEGSIIRVHKSFPHLVLLQIRTLKMFCCCIVPFFPKKSFANYKKQFH